MFKILFKTSFICIKNIILYKVGLVDYYTSLQTSLTYLSKLNIFYTKIFQWVADNNFNDERTTECIKKFTDSVDYVPEEIDYVSLLDLYSLSKRNNDDFILTSMIPLNSGTVSLVFKGELNGNPVVVKVLRVGIREKLEEAIIFFNSICNITNYLPYIRKLNVSKIIGKNVTLLRKQIDFMNEVKNITIFSNAYKDNKTVRIPAAYQYYTEHNNKLIVMEYLHGKSINESVNEISVNEISVNEISVNEISVNEISVNEISVNEISVNEIKERDTYYNTLTNATMLGYLKHGIIHGDLHSGNVVFLPDGVIGYLDFGIIYVLNIEHQDFLYNFFLNFSNGDFIKMVDDMIDEENIETCLTVNDNIDELREKIVLIKKDMRRAIKDNKLFINGTVSHCDIFTIIGVLGKYNIEFNDYIAFIMLASISTIGMCAKLANNNMYKMLLDNFKKYDYNLMFQCG
jgi:tRNA A-37 threonylcarbamoyl transferase component Bud32